jgi:hypothetical protein
VATYYVRPDGSNSNAGTGTGTTQAKATVAAGIALCTTAGDILWIAPGTYREVNHNAGYSGSAGTPITMKGDVTGATFGVAAGPVILSAYTTDDVTAPSATSVIVWNSRSYWTFEDLLVVGGGSGQAVNLMYCRGITLNRCVLMGIGGNLCVVGKTGATPLDTTFDSCVMSNLQWGVALRYNDADLGAGQGTDVDLGLRFTNCFIQGSLDIRGATHSGTGKPGGIRVQNCYVHNVTTTTSNWSQGSLINEVRDSIVGTIAAAATTQLAEVNCHILVGRTNVTAGTGSKLTTAVAPLFDIGQSFLWNLPVKRTFMTPSVGAPHLNWGLTGTAIPTTDMLGRPRPAGSGLGSTAGVGGALGPLERHDTAVKETSTTDAGSVGLVIVGPGDHNILIPVPASATTITVRARYDSTHAATNKPQAILLANAAIGVTTATATMSAAADTWETLTLGPFTPTAVGVVTVRLVSRSAAGGGKAFFDTMVAPALDTGGMAYFLGTEPLGVAVGQAAGGGGGRLVGGGLVL